MSPAGIATMLIYSISHSCHVLQHMQLLEDVTHHTSCMFTAVSSPCRSCLLSYSKLPGVQIAHNASKRGIPVQLIALCIQGRHAT